MIALAITMTTDQGLVFGLALIAIGMIIQAGLTRWSEADDEQITETDKVDAAHDQAIALTVEAEPTLILGDVPVQRGGSE